MFRSKNSTFQDYWHILLHALSCVQMCAACDNEGHAFPGVWLYILLLPFPKNDAAACKALRVPSITTSRQLVQMAGIGPALSLFRPRPAYQAGCLDGRIGAITVQIVLPLNYICAWGGFPPLPVLTDCGLQETAARVLRVLRNKSLCLPVRCITRIDVEAFSRSCESPVFPGCQSFRSVYPHRTDTDCMKELNLRVDHTPRSRIQHTNHCGFQSST